MKRAQWLAIQVMLALVIGFVLIIMGLGVMAASSSTTKPIEGIRCVTPDGLSYTKHIGPYATKLDCRSGDDWVIGLRFE